MLKLTYTAATNRGWRVAAVIVLMLGTSMAMARTADAKHFGFKGGFRGSHGFSGRGFSSRGFGGHSGRFRSFRSSGFRGLGGFSRSRFNSLAFRGRRFGHSGFNRFSRFHGGNRFGFGGLSRRFAGFRPVSRSFTYGHFPTTRFHSGFGTFSPVVSVGRPHLGPSHVVRRPVSSTVLVSGPGWDHLAGGRSIVAAQEFAKDIESGKSAGTARVGYSMAVADGGDLALGVVAMRRAFTADKDGVAAMKLDEKLRPMAERVTHLYEKHREQSDDKADDSFMLAALYQMQGDPEMAMMAMDYAKKEGNQDVATGNLDELIHSEMKLVPMTTSNGWELLADGKPAKAVDAFIDDIEKDVAAGAPKLGYALAEAASGDLDRGVWAMRRAFTIDPEGASDVMLSGELRPMVQEITHQYEKDVEDNGVDPDNALMLATLYQLQGDVEAAEVMVKQSGEDSDSFVSRLVTEEMETQIGMMTQAMTEVTEDTGESKVEKTGDSVIGAGQFGGQSGHTVSGEVRIVKTADGHEIRFGKDFSFDDAPDPKIAFGKDGYDAKTLLSELKSKKGAQTYQVPAKIDPKQYNEVWVWCEKFNVPLAVAKIKSN